MLLAPASSNITCDGHHYLTSFDLLYLSCYFTLYILLFLQSSFKFRHTIKLTYCNILYNITEKNCYISAIAIQNTFDKHKISKCIFGKSLKFENLIYSVVL